MLRNIYMLHSFHVFMVISICNAVVSCFLTMDFCATTLSRDTHKLAEKTHTLKLWKHCVWLPLPPKHCAKHLAHSEKTW